jgi:hypothetical protein
MHSGNGLKFERISDPKSFAQQPTNTAASTAGAVDNFRDSKSCEVLRWSVSGTTLAPERSREFKRRKIIIPY